ncbi:hypothetical protein CASFOL_002046 [Castilleja foliolosa]|uniref:Uncharacterized protein n=1 Tax=Castilleja foliolosa TaxID=1961234 RepID=A0ABD3ED53_9LAMI
MSDRVMVHGCKRARGGGDSGGTLQIDGDGTEGFGG